MEAISYFNALLADSRITMLQMLDMQRPLEVARVYVLLLYMGITPDASLFLQQLCLQNSSIREDIFYTNVLLAGRCLTAHPTVRETGLRAQIIERLFELLTSTQYNLLRQEAIKVVCSIGVFETNSRLVTLLSDERLDAFMRWNIADALGALGERSVAGELVQLLSDERLHAFVRTRIAEALGRLAEGSVAGELVQLLSDERLGVGLRRSIASALAAYADDISIVEGLIKSLQDKEISDSVYSALWTISRRGGMDFSYALDSSHQERQTITGSV